MRYFTLVACLLVFAVAFGQSAQRYELEQRRKALLQSIKETEDELAATSQNKKATMSQLRALQAKLAERQKLIGNINEEIGSINSTISSSSNEVEKLRQNLEQQKIRYAQTLRYAYETRSSYDMIAFLFSSNDFNDAVRRMKYLKKFRDARKEQVEQIRITQGQIQHKIGQLNAEKASKDELLNTQMQQKQTLQQETNQTDAVVKDLKGHEKELQSEIQKNKKIVAKVNKNIEDVIRREIEEARKKAEAEARKKAEEAKRAADLAAANAAKNPTTPTNIKTTTTNPNTSRPVATTALPPKPKAPAAPVNLTLTPEAAALSNSFEANRGRLPWPVEKGFVAEQFGVHQHPVFKDVQMDNNGVGIRTSAGAAVRAVFDGVLTRSFYIPGAGWTVIITHGRYFTVYSGLANVSAKKDEQIHTKQVIGTVGTNDDGDPILNFQIWKDTGKRDPIKMDPNTWIAR